MTIETIAEGLLTEDNRCTSNPIFMVRSLDGSKMINRQPCFTLAGAESFLAKDGHNHKKPDIYVASGYRNAEWECAREYIKIAPAMIDMLRKAKTYITARADQLPVDSYAAKDLAEINALIAKCGEKF